MSRTRLLTLLVAGLLLTNILLVVIVLFRSPGHPPHRMPREIIIERLHFTDAQVAEYDQLIKWHRGEIRKADEEIIELKDRLYSHITAKNVQPDDSLLAAIGRMQVKVETIHYKHFQDIRKLCTPQQLPYFDELLTDIATIFSKPKKGPEPH